jgi:hypothetical protein
MDRRSVNLAGRAKQSLMVAGTCNHREFTLPPITI